MTAYRNPANIRVFVGLAVVLTAIAALDGGVGIAALVAVGILYVAGRNLWPKLTVTSTGVELRNYRTRTITWAQIHDIAVEPRYGTSHLWFVARGKRIPCLAVSASPLGAPWVDQSADEIRSAWKSQSSR